jgi:hypothetical protein
MVMLLCLWQVVAMVRKEKILMEVIKILKSVKIVSTTKRNFFRKVKAKGERKS